MKITKTYRTIIVKENPGFHGYVPALPGCHSDGRTFEETQKNLKEAIEAYLMARQDLEWDTPEDTLIESLQTVTLPSNLSYV